MRRNVVAEVLRDDTASVAVEYLIVVSMAGVAMTLSFSSVGEVVVPLFERVTEALKVAAR